MTLENPLPRFRKRGQDGFGRNSACGESRADLGAKVLETLLLRHQDKPVSQPKDGKRRTRSQAKVLAVLLGDGNLPLLADLGRSQVFKHCLLTRHV